MNYASSSISTLTASTVGGGTGTTAGSLSALNFSGTASFIRGTYWCVTASGQPVKVTRRNRAAALACLAEVERRLGRRPTGVKY